MLSLAQYNDSSSQEDVSDAGEGTERGSGFGLLPCALSQQQPDRGDDGGCQATAVEPAGAATSLLPPAHLSNLNAANNPPAMPPTDSLLKPK